MIKSKSRVHPAYIEGTKDWDDQYNMLLPDGINCAQCIHCYRCVNLFGSEETDTSCQWHPNRFITAGKEAGVK